MTGAQDQQTEPTTDIANSTVAAKDLTQGEPVSPARSDKSSDSEGKPVREKLKETRIDTQAGTSSEPIATEAMKEANGHATTGDRSASGSDSDIGRVRRKRSREELEDDHETEKQPEKKVETGERHARKRSRDITKDDLPPKIAPNTSSIPRIDENDAEMTSPKQEKTLAAPTVHDSTQKQEKEAPTNGESADKGKDGAKKDDDATATTTTTSATKIPSGSGFANTSSTSPFASIPPKPKGDGKTEPLPQTSDDKFKASGFGSFASSTASPFGGLTSPKASSASPFGAASGNKLSSFAGSKDSSTPAPSGFGALGSSNTKSTFGGSSFGGSLGGGLGGGFGSLGGSKPGLSSFASPGGTLEIKGLKAKADKPFGTAQEDADSEDQDGGDSDTEEKSVADEERKSSQPLLSQQPHETGEEGWSTLWAGRGKLYTMSGEGSARGWKERGSGTFKFLASDEKPTKARFLLHADATHRLLLNMAVAKSLKFGADAQGSKPVDGRILFNEITQDGTAEMHLLRMKAENAIRLWEDVTKVQEVDL